MFAVIFILVYADFFKLGVKSGAMSLPVKAGVYCCEPLFEHECSLKICAL